ncbi:WbqC family protein [Rummeliibacillus sp. NPDC094406]|uniref:WbqC family protein n=1 Tax=Rummeliibacillus sp. NPDC094406 TaxID=3364511 RepID=UPI0038128D38
MILKCAIMQPTYLPWAGYFSMISNVDKFVFFDDVQFARRSWQQRNRIILNKQEKWLTVPVEKKGKRDQLILEVEVLNDGWRNSHSELLKQAYQKHPYFRDVQQIFEESVLNNSSDLLCDINIQFISTVMRYLEIDTEILYSSQLQSTGKKSEYLLKICEEIDADTYVSAPGSLEYITEEGYFSSSIKVEKFDFVPKKYNQKCTENFIPYLSILDVIANLGRDGTKEYLKLEI